ncbi:hypothetical protein ABKV19_002401 [Rosa sericea]
MVFIATPNHKTLTLNLNPKTTTLLALKHQIQQTSLMPISHQRLFLSQSLHLSTQNDAALLSDLGIGPLSTLTLHTPFLGGTQPHRYAFLTAKPPPNYVAGLGRGATGFTTRSDIGPARSTPPPIGAVRENPDDEDKGYDENQKFDEFEGNDMGLFANAEYDEDDDAADAVYAAVDERMDSRRKERREAKKKEMEEKSDAENPKKTPEELKRKLRSVSVKEWESLPEMGDYSWKNRKRRKFESFVPVPDTLFEKARLERQHVASVDPMSTDLTALGEGKGTVMKLKLDRLSVSGLTSVDPKGYLSGLLSMNMNVSTSSDVSDIKKTRQLYRSVRESKPKDPCGWIAAARLEEMVGKLKEAREIIKQGCHMCPKNEDVWLEACRLVTPSEAKVVVAMGVKQIPNSVDLWMRAVDLEHDKSNKKKVLWKALDQSNENLRCVRLWKAVMDLCHEDDKDMKVLLHRAVEVCPLEVQFWVALARSESYEAAKMILNNARVHLPKERAIWVEAAKLEEARGNVSKVGKIIERGIKLLQEQGLVNFRETWMKEAEKVERAGHVAVCQAIIQNSVGVGVEEEDRKRTWLADAEEYMKSGSIETARAIYAHALTVFLTKKSVWRKAAMLEKSHGTKESLDALLRRAVKYLPQVEFFWLMAAKENWLAGDVNAARMILEEASKSLPNSEEIMLAAFKLEFENHEQERARMILDKTRARVDSGRVWMKSAILQRELGNSDEEKKFLEEGLKCFPSFFKLWLMLGQLEERLSHFEKAKAAYESGLKHCSNCIPLWLSLANLEEQRNGLSKARAVLTTARKKNSRNPELWLAAVRAELRHGNKREADTLMAKALQEQECPNSGILWAASIGMVPGPQRKTRSLDAYKYCGKEDPHVNAAVAKLLWHERKIDRARTKLNLAVTHAPDIGDFWTLYYKFELQNGTEDTRKDVLERCVAAQPKHGEKWQTISKAVENWHQPTEAILKKAVKEDAATAQNQQ